MAAFAFSEDQFSLNPRPPASKQLPVDSCERKSAIAKAFGRAASTYDQCAEFQRIVGHRLMDKLPKHEGAKVLDMGCGTGYFSQVMLSEGFDVIAADLSPSMLEQAKIKCGNNVEYLLADVEQLPLADSSVDIAFSSLALQWCNDLSVPLAELKRVVKPGGIIVFSTLLEGSLTELRDAWITVDNKQHVNRFLSSNLINIALAQAGIHSYTLDCASITMKYPSAMALMKDLKGIGATHLSQGRSSGLGGKNKIRALEKAYKCFETADKLLPATYQVCFGVIKNE